MSVRKRLWPDPKMGPHEAWQVSYVDGQGARRRKQFRRKRDADAFEASAKVEVRQGVHVADSASITVEQAGKDWIESVAAAGREQTTIDAYQSHLTHHINPMVGTMLLSRFSVPDVRKFEAGSARRVARRRW